ncbi:hypothetical protein D7Z26_08905 [Cohnella endophytica]|uniref:DUF2513 domain-containing protein n=1 Tax=Cohnella endophytica TaxID=2419778 RepID=A0A494XXT9_9BACL|nr:hypothetical protein [Cohnella endophytica]RKP55312.1 hypothetical protein D7Z26_08905 [Cohnella endophytica]
MEYRNQVLTELYNHHFIEKKHQRRYHDEEMLDNDFYMALMYWIDKGFIKNLSTTDPIAYLYRITANGIDYVEASGFSLA